MARRKLSLIGSIFGFFIVNLLTTIMYVVAEDGDGTEIGDFAEGTAIAGIVLFAFAALTGLTIFLSMRPPFMKVFQKMKLKMKTMLYIHHPLTIITIVVWILHGIPFMLTRGEGVLSSGLIIAWVSIVLLVTGFLFPLMKNFKRRRVLRYIHLILMVVVAILIGIHIGSGEGGL